MRPEDYPLDPIDFLAKEKWITITAIGSIFTFAMVSKFRENVFDPLLAYLLPPESFEFMKVELPDIGLHPTYDVVDSTSSSMEMTKSKEPYTLNLGPWIRETLVWLFMIMILYIVKILTFWPDVKGGSDGSAVI